MKLGIKKKEGKGNTPKVKAVKGKKEKDCGKNKFVGLLNMKSIASKIMLIFASVIILMVACMAYMGIRAHQFNEQNTQALENLSKINYIKEEALAQPSRILGLCVAEKEIAGSGEDEVIQNMVQYLTEVNASIAEADNKAYAGNIGMANTVQSTLNDYVASVQKVLDMGDGTHYPPMDSTVNDIIKTEINVHNAKLSTGALNLMTMELTRSLDAQQALSAEFDGMLKICMLVVGLVIIASIVLCIMVTRSITHPIAKLKKEIMLVADGDLSRESIVPTSKDETRALTDAFNSMTENLKKIMNHVSIVADELDESSQIVSESIVENEKGADGVAEAIEHMTGQMAAQSAESESTMSQVREMNNVSERIRGGIDQINDNAVISMEQASDGTELIEAYSAQLVQVNEVMAQAADLTGNLTNSTKEMNEILKSITDISSQTRMLSLNASIEAARAGEAGRGFAVVATEIGNLANDTQIATAKITEIIKTVQNDVTNMTDSMNTGLEQLQKSNSMAEQTKGSFRQIADTTSMVSASIEEITSEMQLLTELVEKVVTSMEEMDKSIDANKDSTYDISALVTEQNANLNNISTSAQTLTKQSADLHDLLSQFKLN